MKKLDPFTVALIAKRFSSFLLQEIGKENLRTVIQLNKTAEYAGCCASHDYADANIIMADAFEAVTKKPFKMNNDVHIAAANTAWNIAKENNFFL